MQSRCPSWPRAAPRAPRGSPATGLTDREAAGDGGAPRARRVVADLWQTRGMPKTLAAALLLGCLAGGAPRSAIAADRLEAAAAERFAALALSCVHAEYPNKVAHVLASDADVAPPRRLYPAFYGCYDWHSAVHGHWLLARLARQLPEAPLAAPARAALARSLTLENVAGEVAYLEGEGRASFERPYGLAWLLQLAAELDEWGDPMAAGWLAALAPLERAAAERLADWLPKLAYPIRAGEHSQTAFAFGLVLDWARARGASEMEALLTGTVRRLYAADRGCPLDYEPSGQDFLSPCLGQADLVRRVMEPPEYAAWLGSFLPQVPLDGTAGWLPVAEVTDRTDPKLAHLDGLNLSRAWMLEGIAAGLPPADPRRAALGAAAAAHAADALPHVTGEHYEGGHWLGSFATYLVTRRGLEGSTPRGATP
jgi:hypothetical protein